MSEIVYPAGCRPITEDLGADELMRRLKALSTSLQNMGQEDGMYQVYIPLALHLADEHFLTHPSRDVQLLIACCIADVLRVYAPEAPYKEVDQVKHIFMFIIKQLNGLKDPKDTAFKRYFYLLENLAYVKSFNMCLDIEDSQEIFCALFSLMFRIISDEHSNKVKTFMLDILTPLIVEADNVSTKLLDIILINLVEPVKSQKKNSYNLAKELVVKTADTLREYVQQYFNQVLVMDTVDKNYAISAKIYDLIYELNVICPKILIAVLPQLECKLKSAEQAERLQAVSLLARMFSEPNSTLAKQHSPLWIQFVQRFCDISVHIRTKCVQSSMHFLLNHPTLRSEIIKQLKNRQHDTDETVRYEVVMAIVETAKRDFQVVSDSEALLEFVKERTLDKKYKIRREAMNGLAMIYKKYLSDSNVPEATKKAVNWIKDKILHGYYMTGIEDRLLVERLLTTCLVPYTLPADDRMKKLYQLLGTIDENATKAFVELQKNQCKVRRMVFEWVKMHRGKELSKDANKQCGAISRQLPDPVKAVEFLLKFSAHMRKDETLLKDMEKILSRDVSCKDCADTMAVVLKKLGPPIMTNLYYNTVKMLLERIASVMVDREAIESLVELIEECLHGGDVIDEIGLPPGTAGERGLKLLTLLSYVFSAHFQHESILQHMIALLSLDDTNTVSYILKAFTHLGRYKPLNQSHPNIMEDLGPICRDFAITGTPKQAKHAVRCLFVNTQTAANDQSDLFHDVIESFKINLNPEESLYRTAIVTLGHVAYNLPEKYNIQIKNIISRKIVKELLVKNIDKTEPDCDSADNWCQEDDLSEQIKCRVEGLKTMARWLMGLKNDTLSAQKTFRMLHAFIKQKGDLLDQGNLMVSEMSWLRLSAGKAMLKICEQKGVGDQFNLEQFYGLSQMMVDPVPEVRSIFAKKLHKGLNKGLPQKCLPLDFMGFYVLAGKESDKRLQSQLKTFVETDISRRREYVKSIATVEKAMSQLSHILPDYMLVFAVPVLTHDPTYTKYNDPAQLKIIEKCLWFIMEPLITNKEFFCFGLYKKMIDQMKNCKDQFKKDCDETNKKMWAICDVAMHLIFAKATNYDSRVVTIDARIPDMYFAKQPEDFNNTTIYIPMEMYGPTATSKKMGIVLPTSRNKIITNNKFGPTDEIDPLHSDNDIDDDNDEVDENDEPPPKRLRPIVDD